MNCNNIEDRVALVTANINEYTTLNYPAKELLFIMTSKNSGGDGFQKAISWTSKREWNRILQNGEWKEWYEIATKSDLTGYTNIDIACGHEVQEYLRYSTRGNIAIVDIGGIIMPYGDGQIGFILPFMPKNRQVGIVHTDASVTVASTICYSMLGENEIRFHITSECANKPLYGTLVFAL